MKTLLRWCSILFALAAMVLVVDGLRLRSANHPETPRVEPAASRTRLAGQQAIQYLTQTSDGRSLASALTRARFGLRPEQHAPENGTTAVGYVGMSHEQNLNAWFGPDGVTIRPTRAKEQSARGWSVALHLKASGYGQHLSDVPPIVLRQVKENRIEYQRGPLPQEQPSMIEWYENRAEGIEQGFTLNERPAKIGGKGTVEPLRLSLAISGELHAMIRDKEQAIELVDEKNNGVLSYDKLIAKDANGVKLATQMEASVDGCEITLVVEDAKARYPIVIDPTMASLEQKLRSDIPQADARFGTAVAIDGDMAIVGAWREDVGLDADVGAAYVFIRSGSAWALDQRFGSVSGAGRQCGYSVAISGNRIVFGCPGDNDNKGTAQLYQRNGPGDYIGSSVLPGGFSVGERFGASVALKADVVIVGAPGAPYNAEQNAGSAWLSKINANATTAVLVLQNIDVANAQFGTAVAIDSTYPGQYTAVMGVPGIGAGTAQIIEMDDIGEVSHSTTVSSTAGAAGDEFGQSVAISNNTAVIGAWGDDENGTDAGAAYVFVRDQSTLTWSQQQKLTASDGIADDFFSISAVAIQDNTIVVGAYGWDATSNVTDETGAAYVYTRRGTTWTQQTQVLANDANTGDNFGIGVGLSGDTAIIGARHATAVGTAAAGAAYVYRLPHSLGNISTRLQVETGDNVLIGGFIITGTQPKKVIVRAIGPSLPLAGALADPILELRDSSGNLMGSNDNWRSTQEAQILATGIPPVNDLESAIVAMLPANNAAYTAIVRGTNNGTGIGVVEAYDLDQTVDSQLANISTRGLVQTGDDDLIAGMIVVGQAPQKVLIRALGPSIPVPGRMSDPTLELHDSNGALLEANDNWVDSPNRQAIMDTGIAPTHDLESAILRTLALEPYTAIVSGFGGSTGIAVVEVYALH